MTLTQINKAGLDEIALDHVFTIGASGNSAYTFQGEGLNGTVNNPTLYLTRGKTYRFENGSGGHPIRIQSTSGASGTAYNTGVTNNATAGTVIVEVQHDAPDVLYYQCTSHAAMNGILYITGALADGGVTTAKLADDAVNNDKLANSVVASIAANTAKTSNATHTGDVTGSTSLTIANDAVTTAKIAAGAITEAKLDTNAVTTNKIANSAINQSKLADASINAAKIQDQQVTLAKLPHGTSSNDGKFLRANNGADPSFESIPAGTTINNQADNRIITATGTTDTLNGESNLLFNGYELTLASSGTQIVLQGAGVTKHELLAHSTNNHLTFVNNRDSGNITSNVIFKGSFAGGGSVTERFRITGDGVTFNGDTAAANALDDYEEGTWIPTLTYSNGGGATLSEALGHYTKIGRKVHVQFAITVSAQGGGSGNVHINGLPVSTGSTNGFRLNGQFTYHVNFNSINSMIVAYVPGAGGSFKLYQFASTGTSSQVTNVTRNHIQTSTEFRGHATYYVD